MNLGSIPEIISSLKSKPLRLNSNEQAKQLAFTAQYSPFMVKKASEGNKFHGFKFPGNQNPTATVDSNVALKSPSQLTDPTPLNLQSLVKPIIQDVGAKDEF